VDYKLWREFVAMADDVKMERKMKKIE